MSKLKMFCLPYAGGSKSIYFDWIEKYSDIAEVVPIEYSGHGSRFGEKLYDDAEKVADDVYSTILKYNPSNYILYGHSMGSLISYLTAIRLEMEYRYRPKALIIGGTRPPHLRYKDEKIAELPKNKMLEKIFEFGQMDDEIMDEPELIDLLYEIFKADFTCNENYAIGEKIKVRCPIFVATGLRDDEAPVDDMGEWKMYTDSIFSLKTFDDTHMFPFTSKEYPEYLRKKINDIIHFS